MVSLYLMPKSFMNREYSFVIHYSESYATLQVFSLLFHIVTKVITHTHTYMFCFCFGGVFELEIFFSKILFRKVKKYKRISAEHFFLILKKKVLKIYFWISGIFKLFYIFNPDDFFLEVKDRINVSWQRKGIRNPTGEKVKIGSFKNYLRYKESHMLKKTWKNKIDYKFQNCWQIW